MLVVVVAVAVCVLEGEERLGAVEVGDMGAGVMDRVDRRMVREWRGV